MTHANRDLPIEGRFEGGDHLYPLRVYFEDTDLTGAVYHANYLRFLERARSDMLRIAGIGQRAAFEAGEGAYAVTGITIRYRRPARLEDDLLVLTRLLDIRAASSVIHQRVMRDGDVLAEAEVTVAFVSPDGAWTRIFERLRADRTDKGA